MPSQSDVAHGCLFSSRTGMLAPHPWRLSRRRPCRHGDDDFPGSLLFFSFLRAEPNKKPLGPFREGGSAFRRVFPGSLNLWFVQIGSDEHSSRRVKINSHSNLQIKCTYMWSTSFSDPFFPSWGRGQPILHFAPDRVRPDLALHANRARLHVTQIPRQHSACVYRQPCKAESGGTKASHQLNQPLAPPSSSSSN